MSDLAGSTSEMSLPSIAVGVNRSTRIPELDGLRGIGALAILSYHLWPTTFFFGWTRAELFFVLSGYLITSIILRHDSSLRFLLAFWARRILRIWPAYYLLLAIVCIRMIAQGAPLQPGGLIAYLTFTQNLPYYWSGDIPQFPQEAIHTWSLAIEEQFYLLWPLIAVLAGHRFLILMAFWLMANSIAARMLGLYPAIAITRCDGLALGAILAATLCKGEQLGWRAVWTSRVLATIGLAALVILISPLAVLDDPMGGVSGCGPLAVFLVNMFYCSIVGLVILHTGHLLLLPLRCPVLVYMGRISYGVFLFHPLIIDVIKKYSERRTIMTDITALLLSMMVGALSWECLERPFGHLKKMFRYTRDYSSRKLCSIQ